MKEKQDMAGTVNVTIRLPSESFHYVKALAEDRDATFHTMLLYLIEAGIQQERAVKRIL